MHRRDFIIVFLLNGQEHSEIWSGYDEIGVRMNFESGIRDRVNYCFREDEIPEPNYQIISISPA